MSQGYGTFAFIAFAVCAAAPFAIHGQSADLERIRWTGLPLIGGNSDIGPAYGGVVIGTLYDPSFEPYEFQSVVRILRSAWGYESYTLGIDAPHLSGSDMRLRSTAGYNRLLTAQYYGLGNHHDLEKEKRIRSGNEPVGTNLPTVPDLVQINDNVTLNQNAVYGTGPIFASGASSSIFNTPRRVLRESQNRYYNYDSISPFLEALLEGASNVPHLRWIAGFTLKRYRIQSYKGDRENGNTTPNIETLLDVDRPVGYDATTRARYVNLIRVGAAWDTRPPLREMNPNIGIFADLHLMGADKWEGSDYRYFQATATFRQYVEILPTWFHSQNEELVFAWRGLLHYTMDGAPFFEQPRIYTWRETADGLGGSFGLRGYSADQFTDRVIGLVNTELRCTSFRLDLLGGMDIVLLAYYDFGRVGHDLKEFDIPGIHHAAGGGVRLVWQVNTVFNASYGRSFYGTNANVSLGHLF